MAIDARKNLAKATVSTGYDSSATSIVLTAGGGAKFPAAPFNAVWWNATDYGDPSDDVAVEIVRVTAISSDTLTITRAQEGTAASAKNASGKTYKLIAGVTKKTIDDIEADISARTTADVSLTTRISTEESVRATADTSIVALIASSGGGDMLSANNLSELTNTATARTNLGLGTAATAATGDFAPASEVTTRATADTSLTTRISTEEAARATNDTSLQTRISVEELARAAADTSLAAVDGSLATRISTEEAARAIAATSFATADTSLQTRLSTEEAARATADTSLTTRISAEESARASLGTSLTTRISTEETTRGTADASLETRISAAEAGGGGGHGPADASLQTRLSTEELTRATADTSLAAVDSSLATRISTEEVTRATADTSLTTRISTEEASRATADTSLQTRVSTEEATRATVGTSLTTRISSEESTRASADASLAASITGGGISDAPSDGSTYARRDGAWEAIPVTEPTLIGTCLPLMNEPPASNFATLDTRNSYPVLDFDDTTEESAFFKLTIPQDVSIANGIAVKIHFMATSATSGNVRWGAAVERLSASSHDLDSNSFGTAAEQQAAVDTTSGEIAECTVTITSLDGLSSGGTFRLKIYRDSTDTTNDTATGDAEFLFAVVTGVA